jgi:hypothetical protein
MPDDKKKQEKQVQKEEDQGQERAVNPLAMRPEGVHVTITKEKPKIKLMKKLFGF